MHFKLSFAVCFNLGQYKVLSSGNELKKSSILGLGKFLVEFCRWLANIVSLGEIAHEKQFLCLLLLVSFIFSVSRYLVKGLKHISNV